MSGMARSRCTRPSITTAGLRRPIPTLQSSARDSQPVRNGICARQSSGADVAPLIPTARALDTRFRIFCCTCGRHMRKLPGLPPRSTRRIRRPRNCGVAHLYRERLAAGATMLRDMIYTRGSTAESNSLGRRLIKHCFSQRSAHVATGLQ